MTFALINVRVLFSAVSYIGILLSGVDVHVLRWNLRPPFGLQLSAMPKAGCGGSGSKIAGEEDTTQGTVSIGFVDVG